MHFMPEDEGYMEKLWPDGYKDVIKSLLREVIVSELNSNETFKNAYEQQYVNIDQFPDFDGFLGRITDMLVIGAEKGGDEIFDDIVTAFLYEFPLPEPRILANYFMLSELPEKVDRELSRLVIDEYKEDEVYIHAFEVGYWYLYENYEQFLAETAKLAVTGVVNGIDNMLSAIYRAFAAGGPLPPARRNPKRIKNWFVPKGSKMRDIPLSRRSRIRRQKEKNAENSDLR